MRFRHPDGSVVHLAYCSNVHPAETVDGLLSQLREYAAGIRTSLGADLLGVGLWLPAHAARVLARDPAALTDFRRELDDLRLEVVTLNAFPYAGFHDEVVKRAVYHPDWSETGRLDYTVDCATVLARLLPEDAAEGSISTVPLGWRSPWLADRDATARQRLGELSEALGKISAEAGRPIRVGLEPEPGCVIDTTADAVERLAGLVDTDTIGVCLDTCHLATGFEEGADAVRRVTEAGLSVVKAQASAALHAQDPSSPEVRAALAAYAEDRFLHQVREPRGARVERRDDLPAALGGRRPLPGKHPWRVHFHVPVHAEPAAPLTSTSAHLADSLGALVGGDHPVTRHVEVETYTWSVLPEASRPTDAQGLVTGIAAEVAWVRDRLLEHGLEQITGSAA
ncbi:MAG: metabolite traffic protein EboE [Nocardioides sp.]|uniref:metabolite traffic protein EboE n=1 Tax=Nocardioides sp. TaxID=35761 RepID=UPI003267ED57